MKYKIQSDCEKQALMHLMEGKYDWVLWSGSDRDQCVQIAGLFRGVPCDKAHANVIDSENNYLRHEQLTFQSRKAAARWVRKHKAWIVEDYKKHYCGRKPHWVLATQWRGKGFFYLNLDKIQ